MTEPETTSCHEFVVMRLVVGHAGKCRFELAFFPRPWRLLADIKLNFPSTLAMRHVETRMSDRFRSFFWSCSIFWEGNIQFC